MTTRSATPPARKSETCSRTTSTRAHRPTPHIGTIIRSRISTRGTRRIRRRRRADHEAHPPRYAHWCTALALAGLILATGTSSAMADLFAALVGTVQERSAGVDRVAQALGVA